MPLLVSPVDGSPMQQIIRNGIEIDRCPTSGGVWLDKGELEKLLAMAQEAAQQDREEYVSFRQQSPDYTPPRMEQRRPEQRGYYRDDDDYEHYHKQKYGRKSKLSSLFDIFD